MIDVSKLSVSHRLSLLRALLEATAVEDIGTMLADMLGPDDRDTMRDYMEMEDEA